MGKKLEKTPNLKNIFGNLSKTILNNIMSCNILPFLWTLKKMYLHWIYKLNTYAQVKPWPIQWGRPCLMHIIKEMPKAHMKWQDDYMNKKSNTRPTQDFNQTWWRLKDKWKMLGEEWSCKHFKMATNRSDTNFKWAWNLVDPNY